VWIFFISQSKLILIPNIILNLKIIYDTLNRSFGVVKKGLWEEEARELHAAKMSLARVSQIKWPHERDDKVPRQHFHLIQIPFDIAIDSKIRYTLVYQIFLHFEKPSIVYIGDTIIECKITTYANRIRQYRIGTNGTFLQLQG
jgi:hypothetical protein